MGFFVEIVSQNIGIVVVFYGVGIYFYLICNLIFVDEYLFQFLVNQVYVVDEYVNLIMFYYVDELDLNFMQVKKIVVIKIDYIFKIVNDLWEMIIIYLQQVFLVSFCFD